MSFGPPTAYDVGSVHAHIGTSPTSDHCWIDLTFIHASDVFRETGDARMTAFIEPSQLTKFQRLAEAINQIFDDQVQPQEKTSEL